MSFCTCLSGFTVRRWAVLAALAIMPAALAASPVPTTPGYPGDRFDWPTGLTGYFWHADLTGVSAFPTMVVDFIVTNIDPGPVKVDTFQIFANCGSGGPVARADFSLKINGTPTPWTVVDEDACLYHDYLDFILPVGETRFTVDLTRDRRVGPLEYADVRFGNVVTAIPLPPTAALMLVGALALAMVRWRAC